MSAYKLVNTLTAVVEQTHLSIRRLQCRQAACRKKGMYRLQFTKRLAEDEDSAVELLKSCQLFGGGELYTKVLC
ncbi:hypothetical protein DPMN_122054 [Dreissena polymorpha]|uniref:Uncharacterized protein n=1 Tax=Dreissena polymorpha TaxID=45954 RepID=A0A9D4JTR7_DREPO|nr:hypothetical protein DPMN_122054 [Dreissena polymorpha]